MRKILITCWVTLLCSICYSQEIEIHQFHKSEDTVVASKQRFDYNGKPCGLVIVESVDNGVKFEGNIVGEVNRVNNKYYIYLTDGTQYLQIKNPNSHTYRVNFKDYHVDGIVSNQIYIFKIVDKSNKTADELYKRAMEFDALSDGANTFKYMLQAAELGHAEAQMNVGVLYYSGYGVPQNFKLAAEWYTKAVENGNVDAGFFLAVCYLNGEGMVKDTCRAVQIWAELAEKGHIRSQYNLGDCYDQGLCVEKNAEKAFYWYKKAAEQGYADSQFKIGWCYYTGNGTSKDPSLCFEWISKAAAQNHAPSEYVMGVCYEIGIGVNPNINQALIWYKKAADKGVIEAQTALLRFKK